MNPFIAENSLQITSNVSGDTIIENDVIQYTCDVRYAGNLIPSMNWTTSSSVHSVIPHSKQNTPGLAKSVIHIIGNMMTNRERFVCTMFFEAPLTNEENTAKNAPDCILQAVTVPLTVHCKYFTI